MNINKQLDKLCMEHFQNRAYVADGIFFGSNTNAWNSIHPKVLFVLKQPNSDDLLGEDYREYDFDTCVGEQVWRELLSRLYGIMHTVESGFPMYDKATETKNPELCIPSNPDSQCMTRLRKQKTSKKRSLSILLL